MKSAIYETTGKAKEYCELALNLYDGCEHGCEYCWAPDVLHRARQEFHAGAKPRLTLEEVTQSAKMFQGRKRPVLLSFTSDVYQPIEELWSFTRSAIVILKEHKLNFTILTKGGKLAQRDFDLYGPGDSFGVTLTCLSDADSRKWEPGAAMPSERINNLSRAENLGIPTWVSLEPVLNPAVSLALIEATCDFVDHYKLGRLNYHPLGESLDWKDYLEKATDLLTRKGKGFYIKDDLSKHAGWCHVKCAWRQLP